ncbi:DUF2306 domain-containing protein [Marinomonas epiphytica]
MATSVLLHTLAACWVIVVGALQLLGKKGTHTHKRLGWSWLVAMLIVAISSFFMPNTMQWFLGYGPLHILSLWIIFCVFMSAHCAKCGKIGSHKRFNIGAYFGAVGAGVAALLMPGRELHSLLFM